MVNLADMDENGNRSHASIRWRLQRQAVRQTTTGNDMRNKQQSRPAQSRWGVSFTVFAVLLMLPWCASAPPIPRPFPLSISRPNSDSFVTITASDLVAGEFTELILQVKTDLTATNWVNVQTNYPITAGQSYFYYKLSGAQSPIFFRVSGIF